MKTLFVNIVKKKQKKDINAMNVDWKFVTFVIIKLLHIEKSLNCIIIKCI